MTDWEFYRLTMYLDNGFLVVKDCASPEDARMSAGKMVDGGCDDIAVNSSHVIMTTVTGVNPTQWKRSPYTSAKVIDKGVSQ